MERYRYLRDWATVQREWKKANPAKVEQYNASRRQEPRDYVCVECSAPFKSTQRPAGIYEPKRCETCARQRCPRQRRLFSIFYSKICIGCGIRYTTYQRRQRCCSRQCSWRVQRTHRQQLHRQAEMQGEFITAFELGERDGWVCHHCGGNVDKALLHRRDRMAPTIDHVEPVSLGGTHTWDNVLLAHSVCNTSRGAPAFSWMTAFG